MSRGPSCTASSFSSFLYAGGKHAAWARVVGGALGVWSSLLLAGSLGGKPSSIPGALGAARGGTPAARSDAPGSRSCWRRRRHCTLPRRMPRAPRSGRLSSLLLMAGLAFAATFTSSSSPLSDDDDHFDASSVIVVGVDGAPTWPLSSSYCSTLDDDTFCPPPCQTSDRSKQCLHYLQDSHKEEVCGRDVPPQRRRDVLHRLRMPHCCEHAVDKALPEAAFHGDPNTCHRLLTRLQEVDNFARSLSCTHADLLTRYDCSQNYSIVHHCRNCKVKRIINLPIIYPPSTILLSILSTILCPSALQHCNLIGRPLTVDIIDINSTNTNLKSSVTRSLAKRFYLII